MSTSIKIKRSQSTATPTSLDSGELAFTSNGDILYIGSPNSNTVTPIGGKRYPGVLTANQALVANSTSYLDVIKTANLYINEFTVNAINAIANTTHLGAASNNELTTTWAVKTYVDSSISYTVTSGSSNAQVLFNNSGIVGGDAGLTYNASTDTLTAGNFSGNGALVTSVDAATVGGNTATTLRNYSDTMAGTAYTNAASYADTKASQAYSNAVAYAASNTYVNTTFAPKASPTFTGLITAPDVTINGNTIIGSDGADSVIVNALVSSNVMPIANNTYHIGNNSLRWAQVHTANVHSVSGNFDGDVQIAGDLTVAGNLVTTDVQSVIVSDPMIYLAGNNYSSDLVDIGIAANYNDGVTNRHTGFFRDASDGGKWKLFYNLTQELSGNNYVDVLDATYETATLQAYLDSGALLTSSNSLAITANSTVSVSITANTVALATALAGTSGGTGRATTTSQSLLVGNTSNGYDVLTLGTTGHVLQSNGSALVYDTLDGGSF
jgi:hypothetical protein